MKIRAWCAPSLVIGVIAVVAGCGAPNARPTAASATTAVTSSAIAAATTATATTATATLVASASRYPPITTEGGPFRGSRPTPAVPAAAAHNHDLTVRETLRLVGLAEVPRSARQLKSQPQNAPGPAMGVESTTSRVASTTYWQVPMSVMDSDRWFKANAPKGMAFSSSGSYGGTAASPKVMGEAFSGPANAAWNNGQLQMTAAPVTPTSSIWRIDGVAIWLNPGPIPDDDTGTRIHVSVADGCPSSDKKVVGVSNPSVDLKSMLVPKADPVSALICRYVGMNGPTNTVGSHQLLTGTVAAHLGRKAQNVSLSYDSGEGAHSCPADDEAMTLIVFGYRDGSSVDLWQKASGCGWVANGEIKALRGLDLS